MTDWIWSWIWIDGLDSDLDLDLEEEVEVEMEVEVELEVEMEVEVEVEVKVVDGMLIRVHLRGIALALRNTRISACIDGWWMGGQTKSKKITYFKNFSKNIRYFFLVVSRPFRRVF